MLAVPDGEERLAAPREATTLWRDVAGGGDLRVGTLAQMGAPALTVAAPGAFVEVDADAHCTVVQIVKRNGTYFPVVDGVVVQSFQHGGRDVYSITAHRGLHEDPIAPSAAAKGAHAFSPCALTVIVDDGQPLPSECSVRIWQQFGNTQAAPMGIPTLSGSALLLPTRVAGNLATVVYAPYPMAHGRQPRITIFDMRKAMASELASMKKVTATRTEKGQRVRLREFVNSITTGEDTMFNYFARRFNLFGTAAAADAAASDADASLSYTTRILRAVGLAPEELTDEQREADAAVAAQDELGRTLAELPALLGQLTGHPIGIVLGAVVGARMYNQPIGTQLDTELDPETRQWLSTIDGVVNGIMTMMATAPTVLPSKVFFTLDELASALEVLGSAVLMSENEMRAFTSQTHFRREGLIWSWLLHGSNKFLGRFKKANSGYWSNNTLDASELGRDGNPPPQRASVITTFSIQIRDSNGCPELNFEFLCSSDDAALLALGRQGMVASIDRLALAITTLEGRLQEAIADKTGWLSNLITTKGEKARAYFVDQFTYGPLGLYLYDAVFKRTGVEKLASWVVSGPLHQLDYQRSGLLQEVLKNTGLKLGAEFVSPRSQAQQLRTAILAACNRAVPPSTTIEPPEVLRTLPHKAKRASQIYASPEMLPTGSYDIETADVVTRERSSYSDTVREMSSVFTREQAVLRHLLAVWERGTHRLIFKTAHLLPRPTLDGLGVVHRAPHDAYALVLQLPRDVQAAASEVPELQRRQMSLIADRSQTSALRRIFKGLKECEATFAALAVYSEFWTGELVRRGQMQNTLAEQARSFAQSSHTAAALRAEACGQLVLDTTAQSPVGFFDDNDPMLKATQAGLDTGVLARRLGGLDTQTDAAGVRWLREVASELFRISKIAGNSDFTVVPSEPLQSLFMHPDHGEFAYRRAVGFADRHRNTMRGTAIVESLCSGYPSLLLVRADHLPPDRPLPPAGAPMPTPQRPGAIAAFAGVREALVKRAAPLRINFPMVDSLDALNKNDLADRFAELNVAASAVAHFYVPFGHGDAPPPLTAVPMSAIMFGSVPVWSSDWRFALLDALRLVDAAQPDAQAHAARSPIAATNDPARLLPEHRGCGRVAGVLPAPSVVRAVGSTYSFFGSAAQTHIGSASLQTYVAGGNAGGALPADGTAAAEAHHQSRRSLALSRGVAEIAWNAERTLQCALIAAARQGPVRLQCTLPDVPPPPPPPGLAPLGNLQAKIDATFALLFFYTRVGIRAMQDVVREVRALAPGWRNKTLVNKATTVATGGDDGTFQAAPGTSDVSHVQLRTTVNSDAESDDDEDTIGAEHPTDASGMEWLTRLLVLWQAREYVRGAAQVAGAGLAAAQGAAAQAAAAAAAIQESVADARQDPVAWAQTNYLAALSLLAVSVFGAAQVRTALTDMQLRHQNTDLNQLLNEDVSKLSDAQLYAWAVAMPANVDAMYNELSTDPVWLAAFGRMYKPTAAQLKAQQLPALLKHAMARRLRRYRNDPVSGADSLARAMSNIAACVVKLSALTSERNARTQNNPAGGLRAARQLRLAKNERRRLLLSYILGVAMARVVLGAAEDDQGAVRIDALQITWLPGEQAALAAGLARLLQTIDGGAAALRLSEACAISELVTV